MRGLGASEILAVWERAAHLGPSERALSLLQAALESERTGGEDAVWDRAAIAALPVGRRDTLLLELRLRSLGTRLEAYGRCSSCGEAVQLAADLARMLEDAPREPRGGSLSDPVPAHAVEAGGYRVRFRLPSTLDLAAAEAGGSPAEAGAIILERCLLGSDRRGEAVAAPDLPDSVRDAVIEEMRRLDPMASVELGIQCPSCGAAGLLALDVAAFVWAEIAQIARALLSEVDALARAYAWAEADILAMSPRRRRIYLQMIT